MIFRRKRIPKPLDPGIPPPKEELSVPFALADQPRIFLDWIARYSKLDEKYRTLIAQWVLNYSEALTAWLITNKGYWAVVEADEIAKTIAEQFHQDVEDVYKEQEQSLFDRLEREMGDDA